MVEIRKIIELSNQGLDIILEFCPQAANSVESPKKAFKYRTWERTASAYLYPPRDTDDWWAIVDYGASEGGHRISPIDLYMRHMGYNQSDFHLAICELAAKYGAEEMLDKAINRPTVEWIDKEKADFDLSLPFEVREGFSDIELHTFGNSVKEEHLKELGWKAAEWVGRVFSEKVKKSYSNINYPIFVQTCPYSNEDGTTSIFYKVYEPKAFDKKDRFFIIGKKPANYIFGLNAVVRKCSRLSVTEDKPFSDDGKLSAIAIVSGGTDAVNCLSMGIQPVYFNSETSSISEYDYLKLKQYAKVIYNIPDIDGPGIRAGRQLALQHNEIRTVWLPKDVMARVNDNRGRKCKDLKDWLGLYPHKKDFDNLLRSAKQAKFWRSVPDKDNKWHWEISLTQLTYFLYLNGYYTLRDNYAKKPRFVRIAGVKVEEVTAKDVIMFLQGWMETHGLTYDLRDTVLRSKDVNSLLATNLPEVDPDFTNSTIDTQWMYFMNCIVEISKDEIKRYRYDDVVDSGRYVWEKDIIPHVYKELPKMFNITRKDDGRYDIEILSKDSEVLCFLINASRMYWRKEMEERFNGDREAMAEYAASHRFCIDGEGLTEEDIADQKQCLVNKIFAYGYFLHQYKQESIAWAGICYDSYQGDDEGCNGRSGKSLYGKIQKKFINTVTIEAKNPKIVEHKYIFANVSEATGLVLIDECHKKLDYSFFFGRVTGDFEVEKKNVDPHSIPFSKSPKMMLATNFVMKKVDSSTNARLLPIVFSDYYHAQSDTTNYLENRSVRDDFSHDLMDSLYTGWNADINFMIACLQFYLSVKDSGEKILPPLDAIEKRQQKARLGKTFEDWADDALTIDSIYVDQVIKRQDLYMNFVTETQIKNYSIETFIGKLKEYCKYAEHLDCINPSDVTGKAKDGEYWRKHENGGQVVYLFIRSKQEAEKMKKEKLPVQGMLGFDIDTDDNTDVVPF